MITASCKLIVVYRGTTFHQRQPNAAPARTERILALLRIPLHADRFEAGTKDADADTQIRYLPSGLAIRPHQPTQCQSLCDRSREKNPLNGLGATKKMICLRFHVTCVR